MTDGRAILRQALRHKRSKYNAARVVVDGISFASKREAAYYSDLVLQMRAGVVKSIRCQVPFKLPGNTTYLLDFEVHYADGSVYIYDENHWLLLHAESEYVLRTMAIDTVEVGR